jgi:hypothetical protein
MALTRRLPSRTSDWSFIMLSAKTALGVLLLLNSSSVAPAQSSGGDSETTSSDDVTVDWTNQKSPGIHTFVSPSPAEYRKAIDGDKDVLRGRILLDGSTTVEFHERPKDIDFYDSTVVVTHKGEPGHSYHVGELIKHQALSLAHVAVVPSINGPSMLVCEYEGGAVGAREGFAILRLSSSGFDLHILPLTDFGKVVVFRNMPDQATVWSALPYPRGADADPMFYSTQACRWETKDYVCSPPKRKRGSFSPASINDPGIEIRP